MYIIVTIVNTWYWCLKVAGSRSSAFTTHIHTKNQPCDWMNVQVILILVTFPQCICIWNHQNVYLNIHNYCLSYSSIKFWKPVLQHYYLFRNNLSSVQFCHSVVSNSLQPHEPQHARPPCPSPTPGVHPNPCPLSRWCHPIISSSVIPFSSCPQSFPASGSFPVSQLFASGGQSIGVSASTSALSMNTQDWSPCSPRDSQVSSPAPQFKSINSLALSFLYSPTLTSIHDHWKKP